RPVTLLVRRNEREAVASTQMGNERMERLVELFWFIAQDFASGFVGEFLNIEVLHATNAPEPSGPAHHAVLRHLLGRFRNDRADDATRFENRMCGCGM